MIFGNNLFKQDRTAEADRPFCYEISYYQILPLYVQKHHHIKYIKARPQSFPFIPQPKRSHMGIPCFVFKVPHSLALVLKLGTMGST
jgi:hypothetical protein